MIKLLKVELLQCWNKLWQKLAAKTEFPLEGRGYQILTQKDIATGLQLKRI